MCGLLSKNFSGSLSSLFASNLATGAKSLSPSIAYGAFLIFMRLLCSSRLASPAARSSEVIPSWNFRLSNPTIDWPTAFWARPCSMPQRLGNGTAGSVPKWWVGMWSLVGSSDSVVC